MPAVSSRVIARNGIGRFISAVEEAATRTVKEAIEEGANLSRELAPTRARRDPRTPKIKESIFTQMTSRTSGYWGSSARHALYQEKGTKGHPIPSDVTFFWEKHWRMWTPGDPDTQVINHPGHGAQPYLEPAYRIVMQRVMSIAKKNYPG